MRGRGPPARRGAGARAGILEGVADAHSLGCLGSVLEAPRVTRPVLAERTTRPRGVAARSPEAGGTIQSCSSLECVQSFRGTLIKVKIIAWRLLHSPAHRNETELGEGPQTGALGGTFYAQSLNLLPRTCAFPLAWSPSQTLTAPASQWADRNDATPSRPISLECLAFLSHKVRK